MISPIFRLSVVFSLTLLALNPATAQVKPGPVNLDEVVREPVNPDRSKAYLHYALAKMQEKENNWQDAERELRQALLYDPKSSALRSEAAEFFLRLRRIKEAVALCQEAIRLDADNVDAHYLLGNVFSFTAGQPDALGSMEDAIREYREVIRIDAKHVDAPPRLAQLYLRSDQPQKAIEVLEAYHGNNGGSDESYYFLAMAYDGVGRLDEAIAAVQASVQRQPEERNLELLGSLLSKAGRSKEAIEIFRQVLGEDGDNVEVQKRLASTLIANNSLEEAVTLLESIVRRNPEDLASRMQLGKAHFGLRKFDNALEVFEGALKLDPSNIGTRFYIAYVYEEKGEADKAIAGFRKLLEDSYKPSGKYSTQEFEDRLLFQRHLAFIYQDSGQPDKAIEAFRSILASQEKAENYRMLIGALRRERRNNEALQLSREAVGKYPDDKYLNLGHSQLLAEVEGWDKGEVLAREMLAKDPKDPDLYLSLSQIYIQAKRLNQAEEILQQAMKNTQDNEAIQFQLAAVYERAKDFKRSETQFLEIIRKNPKNASAMNYLGYMWADRGVRLQEALSYIKQAVDLEPNNGAYLDSLGWVYFRLDQLDKAEQYLAEALKRVNNDPTLHEHMGDLHFRRGDFSKAEASWRQALEYGTEEEEIQKVREKLDKLRKERKTKR